MNGAIEKTCQAAGEKREFSFTQADFKKICSLIYERAGISLSTAKTEMVYNRLSRRVRTHGFTSFAEYIRLLELGDSEEWKAFTGLMTTHLTAFFREQHHFPVLSAHLSKRTVTGTIRLWSCAASTGEEAYTMAITAAQTFGSLRPPVSILATDVDSSVLETACKGVYPLEKVEKLPDDIVRRYFLWGSGSHGGYVKVRPELQQMITFQTLNLLDPVWPIKEQYDAIFCRNVMIYFDRDTQLRILAKSRRHLKHDGLFFAGHSENLSYADRLFRPCGKTVYRAAPESGGPPEVSCGYA